LLFIAGKKKVYNLSLYLVGGIVMWYCMLKSGVYGTIAGVLLAFAIPFIKNMIKIHPINYSTFYTIQSLSLFFPYLPWQIQLLFFQIILLKA
jgi:Na+/H+ antiporter NhaA